MKLQPGLPLRLHLESMHASPVRKGLGKRLEDGRWPGYADIALGEATVSVCPVQIEDVGLPLVHLDEKPPRSGLH